MIHAPSEAISALDVGIEGGSSTASISAISSSTIVNLLGLGLGIYLLYRGGKNIIGNN